MTLQTTAITCHIQADCLVLAKIWDTLKQHAVVLHKIELYQSLLPPHATYLHLEMGFQADFQEQCDAIQEVRIYLQTLTLDTFPKTNF